MLSGPLRSPEARLVYVRSALEQLGSPQDAVPAIHIAGTSGKGSTAYYAASMLVQSGYAVGLLVSPHVSSIAERTQINGRLLSEKDYCQQINQFITLATKQRLGFTYVEFLAVFSFWAFSRQKLDYVVIEVGLGGRLDPTNAMQRADKVCVITDIGMDHTEVLGDSLGAIAAEKAGIIQLQNEVIMYEQTQEIMAAVQFRVQQTNATMQLAQHTDQTYDATLPPFQERNWRLAEQAVGLRLAKDKRPELSPEATQKSRTTRIPGRFEIVQMGNLPVLLDAGHNPQKLAALVQGVAAVYPEKTCLLITAFGANKSKQLFQNLSVLRGLGNSLIATSFAVDYDASHGSISQNEVARAAQEAGFTSIISAPGLVDALALARSWAGDVAEPLIIVTGSFYLLANAYSELALDGR